MTEQPTTPDPDDKDWTWVLARPCPECGYVAAGVPPEEVAGRLRMLVPVWRDVLAREDAAVRPSPAVWSATEYGAHLRDACDVFAHRVELMLRTEDPLFPDWDQDATALAERYDLQRPAEVVAGLSAGAERMAAVLDGVGDAGSAAWLRPGRRSNGSVFTVASLAVYFLHDVVHHTADVGAL